VKELREQALDRETLTIARGAGVVFIGTLLGSVLRYVFQIIIARMLGAQSFGVFSLGFTIFRWISIIAEIGLLSGVVRYVALFRAGRDGARVKGTILLALRLVFLSSSGLGLLLFFLAGPVARGIFHEPELAGVLRWFALAVPFTTPATVMLFSIQAFKIMEYTILVKEILSPLGRLLLLLPLFLLGGKLYGAVATYPFVAILATGLAYRFLTRTFAPLSDRALRPIYESKEILTFSYPFLFAQVLTFANLWMDSTFLGYYWTSQEVGIYSAAQRTAFLSALIMLSFNAIFAPVISGLCAEERFDELGHHFRSITKWMFTVNLPICLAMLLFAEPLMGIFGSQFASGATSLKILSLGWLIMSATGPANRTIAMSGRSKLNLANILVAFALHVGLNLLLIPRHGLVGAAWATTISTSLGSVVTCLEVNLLLHIFPYRLDFLKPLVAGLVPAAVVLFLGRHGLPGRGLFAYIGLAALFAMAYLGILLLLGLDQEDRIVLDRLRDKLLGGQP
jgi:O-antigen/teichoic acid export membrane protein